ncbi:MAG: OmpA family protein [Crocinitomicaceae bacterium]|nr:OmpA family protein [Crocinitomicaceae bacterium]
MKYLILILSFSFTAVHAQETVKLFYNINASEITTEHKKLLDKGLANKNIEKIEIVGYTDYLGTPEYNLILSKKRADNVKKFFTSKSMNVVVCEGKGITGETLESNKGIRNNRRVDVIIYSKNEEIVKEEPVNPDTLKIDVQEIKIGDKLVLKNFNFFPGRHFLIPQSQPELGRLVNILKTNPNLKIELQGHICCETDHDDGWDADALEYRLSFNRAKYIHDELVKAGIDQSRLSYKGFGRSKPLYKLELSEGEKQANRRVEIQIVGK